MRRVIALLLICTLVISGCASANGNNSSSEAESNEETVVEEPEESEEVQEQSVEQEQSSEQEQSDETEEVVAVVTPGSSEESTSPSTDVIWADDTEMRLAAAENFSSLNDPALLRYVEDTVYSDLVNDLDNPDYFVENVSAIYISKEYLEELEYNSQENIFFGYTLSELEEQFQGTKYVFTLDENGETTVVPFEEYDDTYDRVIKNVAIGTGVILLCVTVSVATGGAAPAISMIFAASAKTGTVFALSSGTFSGVAAATVTGLKTGDLDAAVKAGALAGSEGFKWGAISGAILGGGGEAVALHGATLNGLTMNEAAMIQRESGFPLDVIKEFRSMEQYNICKEAGLTSRMVSGKTALIRNIDLAMKDADGLTNLQRMQRGLSPLDPSGVTYELHHIGQKADSTLAILTKAEHRLGGNHSIWHLFGEASQIDRAAFDVQRAQFWKDMAVLLIGA